VPPTVLPRSEWRARALAHEERVDAWVQPHLERRRRGVAHPVHDFLFGYYSQRPAALRRWHPGYGVTLLDAPEYADVKGYARVVPQEEHSSGAKTGAEPVGLSVSAAHLASQRPLIEGIRRLLVATASRPAALGCFGLHEWAMVYRTEDVRHPWPLRLGSTGTDTVVESHRIACSHFDAFRFFTGPARDLNMLRPGRDDRPDFEQPGCLHAGMDLYGKVAVRLSPMICSDLVADAFSLAWDIRIMDMRAAPYDMSGLILDPDGTEWTPIKIETAEGKREYADLQRYYSELAAPIRQRLIDACNRLLHASDA
jgi:hypothetical protein